MPRRLASLTLLASVLVGTLTSAVVAAGPATAAGAIDGPDVSSYQHPSGASISWSAVRRSGKEFAIVKATEGTSYVNPYFARDYAGVKNAGMVRGSYQFARPSRPVAASAMAQARFYVSQLPVTTAPKTLPPALDLEVTGGLQRGELVTWAQDFLLDVRQLTGRTPMIYTYPWFWNHTLGDPAALGRWPLWMATYSGPVTDAATLWQFTSQARVTGIRGSVDMSRLLGDTTRWAALTNGTNYSPWPAMSPGAPTALSGSAGVGSVRVSWLPGDAGSTPVTSYQVVANPGGATVTVGGATTSATVPGLDNGQAYTFTVTARNAVGAGPSATTGPFVPTVPTTLASSVTSSLNYGQVASVRAVLTRDDTGVPIEPATVKVWTRPHGTSSWHYASSFLTNPAGVVATTIHPWRTTDVKLTYAGSRGLAKAATTKTVVVHSLISAHLTRSHTTPATGSTVYGWIYPAFGGVKVARQVRVNGIWRTVQFGFTGSTGAYRLPVKYPSRGTYVYRVVVTPAHGLASGYSPAVTLTVS